MALAAETRASIGGGQRQHPRRPDLAEYTSDNTQLLPFETSVSYWSQGKYMTNPDLVWETTVSRNVGLDFGFFDNRLNGNLDLYLNTTHDQLILFPIKGAATPTSTATWAARRTRASNWRSTPCSSTSATTRCNSHSTSR